MLHCMNHDRLREFIEAHRRLFVLTGAGCSTGSGIPDYRDADGGWKRDPPITFQSFVADEAARRRYWARSLVGWRRFRAARPNHTHLALAHLEAQGRVELLVTQNVDRLHQTGGSRRVVDLHGRLDVVRCIGCAAEFGRDAVQARLLAANPAWVHVDAPDAPDGDADLDGVDFSAFRVPPCPECGGLLKPDVVFFGENVPRDRVDAAMQGLARSDAVLIVGSSLMVYSGFRFARAASEAGKPIVAVNLGRTRADHLLAMKFAVPSASALAFLLDPGRAAAARGETAA